MPTKRYALIAREGRATLAVVAACAFIVQWVLGFYAAVPAWLMLFVLMYIFRDPTQSPPGLPLAVVSPVHGRISDFGLRRDPWLKRNAECLQFESSILDVSSIYAPVEGKILEQWSTIPNPAPGETTPPHSSAFWIKTDEDDDIVLVITRGSWGGPISIAYHPGERVGHGRRIGFANFGCRATLYFPENSRYEVEVGSKVAAGSAVVATLVHLTRMARRVSEENLPAADHPAAG